MPVTGTIDTSIRIAAAPGRVFEVLTDFDNWHQWTSMYKDVRVHSTSADGKTDFNSTVTFVTNTAGMPVVSNTSHLVTFNGPENTTSTVDGQGGGTRYELAWKGGPLPRWLGQYLVQGHHWWKLSETTVPTMDGREVSGTLLEHGEQLEGVSKYFMGKEMGETLRKMLEAFNGRLKQWVEEGKGVDSLN